MLILMYVRSLAMITHFLYNILETKMFLLFVCLVCALSYVGGGDISLNFLSERQKENLSTIDVEKLPMAVQHVVRHYRELKEG